MDGDLSTWTRQVDFEPPSKPDVGRITWVSDDVMHEENPDGGAPPSGAFHETWERVPGTAVAGPVSMLVCPRMRRRMRMQQLACHPAAWHVLPQARASAGSMRW